MVKAENNLHDSHQLFTSQGSQRSLPLHFFLERYAEAYKTEMSDYIQSLENGTPVPANGNDGLQSLKIGLASIMSLQENRPVKLEEINQFQSIKMLK
jgi:myo-inositol 2-dehydrogenase/D-chiro-inositol 1-dehydrogenase